MLTFMLFYCWQKSRNSRVFWCVKFLAQKSGRVKCLTNFKSVRMIIFKRPVPSDDHLQEAWPFGWWIAIVVVVEWLWIGWIRQTRWILWIRSERSLRMIICKRLDPWDVRLQEACSFGWSFARSRPLRMMICKRPAPSIDHLQEASPFNWSFARGRSLWMILCNSCCFVVVEWLWIGWIRQIGWIWWIRFEERKSEEKINGDADRPTDQPTGQT